VSKLSDAGEVRAAATRTLLRTMVSALEITDLLALMMVFATAFSAYATWKTQQVTNQILLISQRPYIGLEAINFVGNTNPKVVEDLRNFGAVQAEQTRVSIVLRVNENALSGDSEPQQEDASLVFSPGVPHRFYRHITSDIYRGALQGNVNLVSETQVRYKGPLGDEHCYLTVYRYDPADRVFCPQRGSLSCDHQTDRVPAR
jgi:hypothetical protein